MPLSTTDHITIMGLLNCKLVLFVISKRKDFDATDFTSIDEIVRPSSMVYQRGSGSQ